MAKTVTVEEARKELGISKVTIARLIKEGIIKTESNPLDRRSKLVRRQELDRLKEMYPVKQRIMK